MILIDVYVPAVDRVFDFELDENTTAGEITEELIQKLAEQINISDKTKEQLCIYAFYRECILDEALTLKEQGIDTGEKLILL